MAEKDDEEQSEMKWTDEVSAYESKIDEESDEQDSIQYDEY
jgi:hypothetical protein